MPCLLCSRTNPIPACVTSLIIGTIADALTTVYVQFNDTTNDVKTLYQRTSDGDGLVIVDNIDTMFPENHSFEISISKTIGGAKENFTVGTEAFDCVTAQFEKLRDSSGAIMTAANHVITMQ